MIVNILDFLLRFAGACLLFMWCARWFVSRFLDKDHLLVLYAEWLINEVKRLHGARGCTHIKFSDGHNVFVFSPEYQVWCAGDDYQARPRKVYVAE